MQKSPLHLSVLIAPVCLPSVILNAQADIVADEWLTVMPMLDCLVIFFLFQHCSLVFLYVCFVDKADFALCSFSDIFSDLCTAALSDSDENEASTWGDVSQDSK